MQILPGIVIVGKALWIKKLKILVVADLHIGYEEALAEEGYLLPRTMFKEMSKELKELLEKLKPNLVVINGDLKHEFGQISKQEWFETNTILDIIFNYFIDSFSMFIFSNYYYPMLLISVFYCNSGGFSTLL